MQRVLRTKLFLGSTTEEIEEKLQNFLEEKNVCPGNYVAYQLYKLGEVYQLIFVFAELIEKG
jgi:hypothetical protein